MDAQEINKGLAEVLGWRLKNDCTSLLSTDINHKPIPFVAWVDAEGMVQAIRFSPATSSDHLREYVLPVVEARGLTTKFCDLVWLDHRVQPLQSWMLLIDPAVLAEAALNVLREGK